MCYGIQSRCEDLDIIFTIPRAPMNAKNSPTLFLVISQFATFNWAFKSMPTARMVITFKTPRNGILLVVFFLLLIKFNSRHCNK